MDIAPLVEAICAVVSVVGASGSFLFMAGRFSSAVSDNTKATEHLSLTVDKLADKTEAQHTGLNARVYELESRVTLLERIRDHVPWHGSSPDHNP